MSRARATVVRRCWTVQWGALSRGPKDLALDPEALGHGHTSLKEGAGTPPPAPARAFCGVLRLRTGAGGFPWLHLPRAAPRPPPTMPGPLDALGRGRAHSGHWYQTSAATHPLRKPQPQPLSPPKLLGVFSGSTG